jgi:hypothetical protein
VAYCSAADLLIGNIPVPRGVSAEQYVQAAADEIDAALGQMFETPILIDPSNISLRPSTLVLKQINAKLASGRLIMAADAGGQDTQLHAYGLSLVREAQASLTELRSSSDSLPGAVVIVAENADDSAGLPRILNYDQTSQVDFFYEYFNPVLNPRTGA